MMGLNMFVLFFGEMSRSTPKKILGIDFSSSTVAFGKTKFKSCQNPQGSKSVQI